MSVFYLMQDGGKWLVSMKVGPGKRQDVGESLENYCKEFGIAKSKIINYYIHISNKKIFIYLIP